MNKKILLGAVGAGICCVCMFPAKSFAQVADWHQGISINPASSQDFASATFDQSVDQAASVGVNYITLIIPLYQSTLYSSDIQSGYNTPSDASLISAITYIHSKGMQVMLKPHLDSFTGEWRAFINPSNRSAWFQAYTAEISHYAQIAQSYNVEDMCIGTELIDMSSSATNSTNDQNWIALIQTVRSLYSGKLTYSANWGPAGNYTDEKNAIDFWPYLDYIGVSAYYNLNTDNQVADLKNAWNGYNAADLEPLSEKWGKPIHFTEIGYKSVSGTQNQPWNYGLSGSPDQTTQANAYEALFEYWNNYSFVQGVDLWNWSSDPSAGGPNDTDYTPQNKLAQQTINQWFNGTSPSGSSSSTSSINILAPQNGGTFSGTLTLKAQVNSLALNAYTLYWQVDNGTLTPMYDSQQGTPHKEAQANIISWNWNGSGPYTINFVAKDISGNTIAQQSIAIMVQH